MYVLDLITLLNIIIYVTHLLLYTLCNMPTVSTVSCCTHMLTMY